MITQLKTPAVRDYLLGQEGLRKGRHFSLSCYRNLFLGEIIQDVAWVIFRNCGQENFRLRKIWGRFNALMNMISLFQFWSSSLFFLNFLDFTVFMEKWIQLSKVLSHGVNRLPSTPSTTSQERMFRPHSQASASVFSQETVRDASHLLPSNVLFGPQVILHDLLFS